MALTRREFLRSTLLSPALAPAASVWHAARESCWLEVLIPFIVLDASRGFDSELVLPSGSFAGRHGYQTGGAATEYEILCYDREGRALETERLRPASMHTTLVRLADLYGRKELLGGARVRVRPSAAELSHFPDLFSAAYVRWNLGGGFSYVHGYPDPPQRSRRYQASALLTLPGTELPAFLSIFNPNDVDNEAMVERFGTDGRTRQRNSIPLKARATILYDLGRNRFVEEPGALWEGAPDSPLEAGSVVVRAPPDKPRVFYFFLTGDGRSRLSSEHPLLLGGIETRAATSSAFSEEGSFLAQGLLYCPLFFRQFRTRGLTLDSSAYLGAGRPLEDPQWLHPFISGHDGFVHWSSQHDPDLASRAGAMAERGVLRLRPHQVFTVRSADLPLEPGFAGGMAVACRPVTNQTVMKIEVAVREWDSVTHSHFRPGGSSSRALLEIKDREGLLSDYVISGVQVKGGAAGWERDSLLGIMNIEFERDTAGRPELALFGPGGFLARRNLEEIPSLGCRFHWVSELFPQARDGAGPFTLRLTDAESVTIFSALHCDFQRRQAAIDHGSDRFSTYREYSC